MGGLLKVLLVFLIGALCGFLVTSFEHKGTVYKLQTKIAESDCNFMVLSDPENVLEYHQIDCKLIVDDSMLITFSVNTGHGIFMDCLRDNSSFRQPAARDCSTYTR